MDLTRLKEWIRRFAELHARAKESALSPVELRTYREGCDMFLRALVAAQRLTMKPGQTPRNVMRVALALRVDLKLPQGDSAQAVSKGLTQDLGLGGFSTILAEAPAASAPIEYKLFVSRESAPIVGKALVVGSRGLGRGSEHVSFKFESLADADIERLERVVLDAALKQMDAL
jgi:hypothetical protein